VELLEMKILNSVLRKKEKTLHFFVSQFGTLNKFLVKIKGEFAEKTIHRQIEVKRRKGRREGRVLIFLSKFSSLQSSTIFFQILFILFSSFFQFFSFR